MATLFVAHLIAVGLVSQIDAVLDNPARPGYVPRGVVVDFAPLPTDRDVSMRFRLTLAGWPPEDLPVTTGEPSDGPMIRDRLARVLQHFGWVVRRLGKTKLEFRTAVVEGVGKRKVLVPIVDIGVTSDDSPPGWLPRVVRPVA